MGLLLWEKKEHKEVQEARTMIFGTKLDIWSWVIVLHAYSERVCHSICKYNIEVSVYFYCHIKF